MIFQKKHLERDFASSVWIKMTEAYPCAEHNKINIYYIDWAEGQWLIHRRSSSVSLLDSSLHSGLYHYNRANTMQTM